MVDLAKMAEMRKLLRDMERAMGLEDLSSAESDIICAAGQLEGAERPVTTTALLEHDLLEGVSRPTFFRALKSLVKRGLLTHAEGRLRGKYVVTASESSAHQE